MKRIAINGMGRIGRASLKLILDSPILELVAVNDIAPIDNIAYLIKYDSSHGVYPEKISFKDTTLRIGSHDIQFFNQRNPEKLPWKNLQVDVVLECTGVLTLEEEAIKHLEAGAKKVVISGPSKSPTIPTIVHGVNSEKGLASVISAASCTTNNISPIVEILGRRIGIKKAIMTTIHANTATNTTVDLPSSNNRMGRSGINNIIPTTTGAATATTKALPQYQGKFDGISVRVPVTVGSLSDITMILEKQTTVDEVNKILEEEALSPRYHTILRTTYDAIVSSDIIKDPHASIADLSMTKLVDGDLLKVLTWYDNEWGFANQLIRQISA